jgi:hypothetical protein
MYVNGGRVIDVMNIYKFSLTMEEILLNKWILEKLTREGKWCTLNSLRDSKCESQIRNNGRAKSRGTFPSS